MSSPKTHTMRPLQDVVFPKTKMIITIDRQNASENWGSIPNGEEIVVLKRKNKKNEPPSMTNMHLIGTLVRVRQENVLTSSGRKVILEGLERFVVENIISDDRGPVVSGRVMTTIVTTGKEAYIQALRRSVSEKILRLFQISALKESVYREILSVKNPEEMLDMLVNQLPTNDQTLSPENKYLILSSEDLEVRFEILLNHLATEIEIESAKKKIAQNVQDNAIKNTHKYLEKEFLRAMGSYLGEDNELAALHKRITALPKNIQAKLLSEWKKLYNMNAMSAEASVIRSHLETICDLPWGQRDNLEKSLALAESSLNDTHFGLSTAKDEILEHIAVCNRTNGEHGKVLCFVGPPGVGKTSLGKSIAKATKRKFVHIALGGVRDEAEIRGHRATYVAARPGKLGQALIRVKSCNPLILLDEIDKCGQDMRGNIDAALLEVLDPEQNNAFVDNYLEVPFSLKECLFICTANDMGKIPAPLLDRMQIIHLSSYTEEEKLRIAMQHLIPKYTQEKKLKASEFSITEEAVKSVIRGYTFEAGVRKLARLIDKLTSIAVKEVDMGNKHKLAVTKKNLEKFLRPAPYSNTKGMEIDTVGVCHGLAYTQYGGCLLHIQVVQVPGSGKIDATGSLGDVMKESVSTAFGFLRSRAKQYGMDLGLLEKQDLRVHVPEGATPKDGPSAGLGLFLAMTSSLLNVPISSAVAVTGEISLTGQVLKIGGLKEKILAAHREGIRTIIIPEDNKSDIQEISESVLESLKIVCVKHASDALKIALVGYRAPQPQD
jgi:ATP-dependent Lon protease